MTSTHEPYQHETILEGLDWTQRGILPDGRLYEHYYPPYEFEKAAPLADKLNIIYAPHHPKEVRDKNLEDVLSEVNGRYAGYLSNTMVHNMGSPKLKTISNVVDPEVEEKIRKGEIAVSFAFHHDPITAKGSLTGIIPDHVLFYDRKLGIPQGDPVAMVYNQSNSETIHYSASYFLGDIMTPDPEPAIKPVDMGLYNGLLDFKKNQEALVEKETTIMKLNQDVKDREGIITGLNTDLEKALDDTKTTTAKFNQDIADLTAKYNQDIEAKDAKIKELETKIENDKLENFKTNQDTRWNRLPKGVQEKFVSRKDEFFAETTAMKLNQDILDFMSLGPDTSNLPPADGSTTQKQNQGDGKVPLTKFDITKGEMVAV
jgi:hypothetical protein